MSLFDTVSFAASDVRALMGEDREAANQVPRCVRMAILTSMTCGEPCWHAKEDVCRCSCGGRNHGCLLVAGAPRPGRMSKIDGNPYKLAAVGLRGDVMPQAKEINGQQWRSMDEARWVVDGCEMPREFSAADAKAARDAGKEPWISQYYYHWGETDSGAPARVKYATRDQLAKWSELAGWKDRGREGVCLLWQIETMPAKPTILRVNIKTGLPLVNQSPLGEQV